MPDSSATLTGTPAARTGASAAGETAAAARSSSAAAAGASTTPAGAGRSGDGGATLGGPILRPKKHVEDLGKVLQKTVQDGGQQHARSGGARAGRRQRRAEGEPRRRPARAKQPHPPLIPRRAALLLHSAMRVGQRRRRRALWALPLATLDERAWALPSAAGARTSAQLDMPCWWRTFTPCPAGRRSPLECNPGGRRPRRAPLPHSSLLRCAGPTPLGIWPAAAAGHGPNLLCCGVRRHSYARKYHRPWFADWLTIQ